MADTILILGNGFDLAQKRKTSYTDFLEFLGIISLYSKFPVDTNLEVDEAWYFIRQGKEIYSDESKQFVKPSLDKVKEVFNDYREHVHHQLTEILDSLLNSLDVGNWVEQKCDSYDFDDWDGISIQLIDKIEALITTLKKDDDINEYVRVLHPILNSYIRKYEEKNGKITIYETFLDIVEELEDGKKLNFDILDKINAYEKDSSYIFNGEILLDLLYLKRSWQWISQTQENLILKFINDNKDYLGQNWSSLELVISDLAEALSDIKQNIKEYLPLFRVTSNLDNTIFAHKNNPMAYHYVITEIITELNDGKPLQSIVDNVNEKFVLALEELTDWLEFYLTYLDELDKDKKIVAETVLDEVVHIADSKVINFNYTDTIKRFGVREENIHFIHGCLNFHRAKDEINTMVFGIEDKQADLDDIATELIPYQKFYQRVVKETGNDFEQFFEGTKVSWNGSIVFGSEPEIPKNIIIYGHSVDPLDKEIFQKCFELAEEGNYDYRFIFVYYNEHDKRSIAKNLAIILGKHEFIHLSGEQKIAFVRWNDKEKMKTLLLP